MTIHSISDPSLTLHDYAPQVEDFRDAVLDGLGRVNKTLPCKFFYDERGSQLFDRICELDEYYPTRTELRIMRRYGAQIADVLGRECLLVEYGSGSSLKTRVLLDHLASPTGYVPIDISREHLIRSTRALAAAYPGLAVTPVCADYTQSFDLPTFDAPARRVAAYFPGSTIGNFEPAEAVAFLQNVRACCGPGSSLLIGVDLKKDPAILHAAYNDAAGVTAQFNLNLLRRINTELDGNFDLAAFRHHACYNPRLGRMEMHLISMIDQRVHLAARTLKLEQGESIHTENCYKYSLSQFESLAASAGYRVEETWLDEQLWFSVQYLVS